MTILVVDREGTPHERSALGITPDIEVFAKRFGDRYFVLASNDGDLFDPLDMGNSTNKRDKERGGMFWQLRKCSQECYRDYTAFLRSKNRTPFFLAQRRFRNDF